MNTDGLEIAVNNQIWTIWDSGVQGVSQAYADAVSSFNSDADEYNDDLEAVETAREEGKTEEEDGSKDLPDRPCAPAEITYPTANFEWDPTNAASQTKHFQIVPSANTVGNAFAVGTLATLNAAA